MKETAPHIIFMRTFPIEFVAEVYNPSLWPLGDCVRQYFFRKQWIENQDCKKIPEQLKKLEEKFNSKRNDFY